MHFKVGRNDSCPCNSGIKYKKCCIPLSTPSIHLAPLYFDNDKFDQADFQDDREILCDAVVDELSDLYFQIHLIKTLSKEKQEQFFKRLHELREEYPKNPVLLNYLYSGYTLLNNKIKANSCMLEMYEKYPLYFFGRFIYAKKFLYDKQYEKAFEVLGRYSSLQELYPERKKLHVTEAYRFYEFLVEYHAAMKDRVLAEQHYKSLVQLASSYPTDNSSQIVKAARQEIDGILVASVFNDLKNFFTNNNKSKLEL